MSIKLKALGLGLLAAMAMGALTVMSASATTPANSHFVSEATEHHLILKGSDSFGTAHQLVFTPDTGGDPISCTTATYHGTLAGATPPAVAPATTTQSVEVRPHYTNCATTTGTWGEVTVDVDPKGTCGTNVYQFTSGAPGTIHVNCEIRITHPNCTIVVTPQTLSGATYKTDTRNGKHSITAEINTKLNTHYHGGICIFLGTAHTATMVGSSTVWGENTAGGTVGITHT